MAEGRSLGGNDKDVESGGRSSTNFEFYIKGE